MAEHREASKHHKLKGSHHSSVGGYNTHGAPTESTPCKIKNETHGAGVHPGTGGGHGTGHTPRGKPGTLLPGRSRARTGY